MIVKMECPQCGATMNMDDSRDFMYCEFCGSKVANLVERTEQNINVSGTVVHKMDRSNEPNLYISYNSIKPEIQMVTRIVSTGKKDVYISGQSFTYHLPQGKQDIVIKIGSRNYNRTIYIPEDNTPVRINASFNGHANINIDQPQYTAPTGETVTSAAASGGASGPKTLFSIIAFILSFTFYGSPFGVGLAIYDLVKGDKDKNHALSKAAIAVGSIMTVALISYLVN